MNTVMECLAPEKWWADQRIKRRTVVFVIVLVFYGWLTASTPAMTPLEAAGMLLMIGLVAGVVIERVVDGNRTAVNDLAVLRQLIDGAAGQP